VKKTSTYVCKRKNNNVKKKKKKIICTEDGNSMTGSNSGSENHSMLGKLRLSRLPTPIDDHTPLWVDYFVSISSQSTSDQTLVFAYFLSAFEFVGLATLEIAKLQ
jgi:hypothetical protein